MCGRFVLKRPPAEVAHHFGTSGPIPNRPPSWNIAPTQDVLAVTFDADAGAMRLSTFRWGLIPSWAKDSKLAFSMINAKAETCTDKPAFREAFKARRCIIPADAFYEWKKEGKQKQPYAIALKGRGLLAFAGLWERWQDKTNGEVVRSCTIITTSPNEVCAPIHDRMPVILPPESHSQWLGAERTDRDQLLGMLKPYPASAMESFPVDAKVGNVKNDGPSLMERVA